MKRVNGIVGNAADSELSDAIAAHDAAGTLETVSLDSADRKKSRLRVESDAGTDLGVLVNKQSLSEGDVLVLDDDRAVVIAFKSREAFVIDLPESAMPTSIVELGHRIGNQHWDIAVETQTVYIPVEADKTIIEDVLGPYLPAGAETQYEVVDANRFIDQPSTDHSHGHEEGHGHSHSADHAHDKAEPSHSHESTAYQDHE